MATATQDGGRRVGISLNAADANGDGGGVDVGSCTVIAMQVTEADTVTTGVVTLELSLNGTDWFATTSTYDASADTSGDIVFEVDVAARYARASLASLTGGGSVTAYITGA